MSDENLRQDWPIPPTVRVRLIQNAVNIADPVENGAASERNRLAAIAVLASLGKLSLEQAKLDLAREKFSHEKAKGEPDAGGMAAVHERMRAYIGDHDNALPN
jgi:hypothetical protein